MKVGKTASRSLTINKEHVEKYAEITGDRNQLHFDEEFVSQTKFKRLVAQGGITTGSLHTRVAMDLPEHGTVFLNQNW
jgi:3-hydroxybutyryl-CoA dehydratase